VKDKPPGVCVTPKAAEATVSGLPNLVGLCE
jgi:hypothetical protein